MKTDKLNGWPWAVSKVHGDEFTSDQIRGMANTYLHASSEPITCIYFLLQDDEIVYVGRTENLKDRLRQHSQTDKMWNRFSFIQCGQAESVGLEEYYISLIRPVYNVQFRSKVVL